MQLKREGLDRLWIETTSIPSRVAGSDLRPLVRAIFLGSLGNGNQGSTSAIWLETFLMLLMRLQDPLKV